MTFSRCWPRRWRQRIQQPSCILTRSDVGGPETLPWSAPWLHGQWSPVAASARQRRLHFLATHYRSWPAASSHLAEHWWTFARVRPLKLWYAISIAGGGQRI